MCGSVWGFIVLALSDAVYGGKERIRIGGLAEIGPHRVGLETILTEDEWAFNVRPVRTLREMEDEKMGGKIWHGV